MTARSRTGPRFSGRKDCMVASEQTLVTGTQLETLCINTIRTLAIDGVQQANSGHPGAPMGLAPVAYCLWQDFLRYDPADPTWQNRDRFVLSNGHASMLLYAMLHLAEVRDGDENDQVLKELAMPMEEIKRFRQLGSRTPGHPESHLTTGVETTTGPLGQGIGNSVGMAIVSKWLAANFNRPGFEIFDFNVYAICGDGDLMEGGGGEAASLAGHLKLSNLCWIYDHNSVTLDGPASWSYSDDAMTRFVGYGWNVTRVSDANDLEMLKRAFGRGRSPAGQEILRLAGGCEISGSRWRARAFPRRYRQARARVACAVDEIVLGVFKEVSGTGGAVSLDAAPGTAGWLGQEFAIVSGGCKRPSDPRQRRQSGKRPRAEYSLDDGRRGGPRDLDQDQLHVRRSRQLSGR